MSDKNYELRQLRYKIRDAINEVDKESVTRDDVADALDEEQTTVLYGHKENEHWLSGFEETNEGGA